VQLTGRDQGASGAGVVIGVLITLMLLDKLRQAICDLSVRLGAAA
jgi:hypothetical protein